MPSPHFLAFAQWNTQCRRVDAQLASCHHQISLSSNSSHTTERDLPVSVCCTVIITAVRKRLIRKKECKQINICLYETVENLQCVSLFAPHS